MKIYVLGLLFLASGNCIAQVNSEIYQEAEVVKNKEKIIYSDVKYDISAVKKQLQKGTGTIKGKMFARSRNGDLGPFYGIKQIGGKKKASERMVYLIPYNDYVKDYIRLKNSSEKPKKKIFVKLHEDVFNTRLEGRTNSEGNFTFPNLKPGKYYIFGDVRTVSTVKKKYYSNGNIATNAYGQVIAEGYSSYNQYSSMEDYVDNIVEVIKDGDVVFVNISNISKDRHPDLKDILN